MSVDWAMLLVGAYYVIVPALIVSDPARSNGLGVVRGGGRGFNPVAGKPARWYFGVALFGFRLTWG